MAPYNFPCRGCGPAKSRGSPAASARFAIMALTATNAMMGQANGRRDPPRLLCGHDGTTAGPPNCAHEHRRLRECACRRLSVRFNGGVIMSGREAMSNRVGIKGRSGREARRLSGGIKIGRQISPPSSRLAPFRSSSLSSCSSRYFATKLLAVSRGHHAQKLVILCSSVAHPAEAP